MAAGSPMREVIRVCEANRPAFQLRAGELGISVFDSEAVDPPLTEPEILEAFRPGSITIIRTEDEIQNLRLELVPVDGHVDLPTRLTQAHHEIRPPSTMARGEFKKLLRELEAHVD